MQKNLVIVESPAKAKTIEKFLGKDYKVMSSYGHIRDLKEKSFSIDVNHDFEPIYVIPDDKASLVESLKRSAAQAETVWLASDEDREGEAIAWHLYETLGLNPDRTRRIVFHEITKNAILNAIENPRNIDLNLVDAQQARRVLDRIVGFELSPVLWKKIKPSLSAGRVQSVAVRLIVDREKEIRDFKPEEYFRVTAVFTTADGQEVKAELSTRLPNEDATRKFLEDLINATFSITDVTVKPLKKSPAPPFTTSTLQQEAARKLGFTVSQTMMVAQRLYEAGHITYMRTDSVNLSSFAIATISDEITNTLGKEYLRVRKFTTKSKGAQEAHEAIRPTYINAHTINGTAQEKRLYDLIWKRTIASQMADANIEKTTVNIAPSTRNETFVATGETIIFDGFLRVYIEGVDDVAENSEVEAVLPPLAKGDILTASAIKAAQRLTQQPVRYTEASLVKRMEELGIGRPSTYAPTISTIQSREYVEKGSREGEKMKMKTFTLKDGKISSAMRTETYGADRNKLIPTDIGEIVNKFLTEYFPTILDYNFTANVEEKFDDIAEGRLPWAKEIREFYDMFHPDVERVSNLRLEHKVGERELGIDPKSGQPVFVKIGRYGPLVQIGEARDGMKPRFASLRKGQSVGKITLEEALDLFSFPKVLGEHNGEEVSVAIGKFGPYVKAGKTFASIPKDIDPLDVDLDKAVELINAKAEAETNRIVKTFDNNPDLQILNGRFGKYISYKKSNYKIPRTVADPDGLTEAECLEIVNAQEAKPKKKARRYPKSNR